MTTYAKTVATSVLAPAGATAVTLGLLLMMYSLIAYKGDLPEPIFPEVRILDFVQDDPPAIVDRPEPPEEIDPPVLPPPVTEITTETTEVVLVREELVTIPFEDPVVGAGNSDTPIATVQVQPEYPQIALQRGLEGWVVLGFDVTKLGSTSNIEVLESEPGSYFDRAAIRALERWKYMPKTVQGEAVRVSSMQTKLVFQLAD